MKKRKAAKPQPNTLARRLRRRASASQGSDLLRTASGSKPRGFRARRRSRRASAKDTRKNVYVDRRGANPIKFYILTDLEGPAGVSSWSQTREAANVNKLAAMDLLTHEVNAAVSGILDVYPRAVVHVLDGHGYMGINPNLLHARANLLLGRFANPLAGLDASFRAMLFVGQHAMAGTPNAPLCHTYSSREVKSYHLNGEEIGEFGCRVLLAASVGVPTIFLSGDDKAAAEASAFLPSIVTVTTKIGGGVEWALHLSPRESRRRIRQGVRLACNQALPKTLRLLSPPYRLTVTLLDGVNPKPWIDRGGKPVRKGVVEFRSKSLLDLPI